MLFGLHRLHAAPEQAPPAPSGGETPIALVVGLGNPGGGYSGNRHNLGFWVVNRLAKRLDIDIGRHTKVVSVGEGTFDGRSLTLAKPRTFMNDSGSAVRELLRRYKITPAVMLVVCDDLDSPVGRVRVRSNGSHGGQNGLKSIVGTIGTSDFPRVRIGVGRPARGGMPSRDPEDVAGWLLADPPVAQRKLLEEAAEYAADAVLCCLQEGVTTAMNRFNGKSPADGKTPIGEKSPDDGTGRKDAARSATGTKPGDGRGDRR